MQPIWCADTPQVNSFFKEKRISNYLIKDKMAKLDLTQYGITGSTVIGNRGKTRIFNSGFKA